MNLDAPPNSLRAERYAAGIAAGFSTAFQGWEFAMERTPRPAGRSMAERDEPRPGQARRIGCAKLRNWGLPGELVADVGLLLSELVTNAFRYGRGAQVGVRLHLAGSGLLRIEVDDGSPVVPHVCAAGAEDESGRGLVLVDATVSQYNGDWGVSADGTKTWCTLRVGPAADR